MDEYVPEKRHLLAERNERIGKFVLKKSKSETDMNIDKTFKYCKKHLHDNSRSTTNKEETSTLNSKELYDGLSCHVTSKTSSNLDHLGSDMDKEVPNKSTSSRVQKRLRVCPYTTTSYHYTDIVISWRKYTFKGAKEPKSFKEHQIIILFLIFSGLLMCNSMLIGILVQLCMMALSRDNIYTRHLERNGKLQKYLRQTLLELSLVESKLIFYDIENTLNKFSIKQSEMPWKWYYRRNEDTSFVFPVYKNDSLESYFQSLRNSDDNASQSMNIEWLRLKTFSELRNINVQPIKLARAGFYCTGISDEVQCFSCGIRRRNWRRGENPFLVHRQISPDCRYVNGMDDTNSPISRREERNPQGESIVSEVNAHDSTRVGHDRVLDQSRDIAAASREQHVDTNRSANGIENGFHPAYENLQQENPSFEPLDEATGFTLPSPHSVASETTTVQEQGNHTVRPAQLHADPRHGEVFRHSLITTQNRRTMENQTNLASQNLPTGSQTPQNNPNRNPVRNTEREVNGHNDVSENRDNHRLPANRQNSGANSYSSNVENDLVKKLTPLGVNFDKPKNPEYAVLTVRMSSYSGWKASQTPREMAEAGFAYAGYSDYARCFFCGGGLKNWEEGDDPWVEHARWFPQCAYLRQNKGDTFVRLVHENLENKNKTENKNGINLEEKSKEKKENGCADEEHVESLASFQSVQQQGYSVDIIKQAIKNLSIHGVRYPHSTEILEEIFGMTENNAEGAVGPTTNGNIPKNYETEEDQELQKLIKENRRMRRQKMCRICEDEEATIAFLPCAHLACCRDCADAVRRCPVCGTPVQGTVKTWLV